MRARRPAAAPSKSGLPNSSNTWRPIPSRKRAKCSRNGQWSLRLPRIKAGYYCRRATPARHTTTIFGDGSTRRDYTEASDIIRGVRSALDWTEAAGPGFEVVNLGGARPTSLIDLVRHLERLLSRPAVLDWQEPQPGDVPLTYADVRHAGKLLGYEPRVPLEEGLARFVQWFMSGEWS